MRFITTILLALLSLSVSAEVVNEMKAYKTANAFLHTYTQKANDNDADIVLLSRGNDISSLAKSDDKSDAAPFYIYGSADGTSFVIISGNDAMKPVLAYINKNGFDTKRIPENLQIYLDGYARIANYCTTNGIESNDATAKAWNNISKAEPEVIVNMETAKWGQNSPYNNYAPTIDGQHCVTGCVATAFSTIAKYHKYPIKGEGSKSYQSLTNKFDLTANFNVEYDWDNMLQDYSISSATEVQKDAVATLMYHMGVLAEMNYGKNESSAYITTAAKSIVNYWGYDKSIEYHIRSMYTDKQWNDILQEELSNMRPILIVASRAQGGSHAFILDGYNSDGLYHVNWGNCGNSDGYFDIDIMDYLGDGQYLFNCYENIITHIFPKSDSSTQKYRLALAKKPSLDLNGIQVKNTRIVKNEPFTITFGLLTNISILDFNGQYTIAHLSKDGDIIEYITDIYSVKDLQCHSGYYHNVSCKITKDINDGDYIAIVYKPLENDTLSIATHIENEIDRIILSTDGSYELTTDVKDVTVKSTNNKPKLRVAVTPTLTLICDTEFNAIAIFDIAGNSLYTKSLDATNSYNINDLELEYGIYIAKVSTAQGEVSCKLIKP